MDLALDQRESQLVYSLTYILCDCYSRSALSMIHVASRSLSPLPSHKMADGP